MRFPESAARALYRLYFLIWTETLTWKMHVQPTIWLSTQKGQCRHVTPTGIGGPATLVDAHEFALIPRISEKAHRNSHFSRQGFAPKPEMIGTSP
jgi:hypothetical protein